MLIPITRQLGIKADLIVQDAPDPRIRRPVIRRDGVLIVPPSPESSAVHTSEITFPPCGELPEFRTHEGSDWMYVLSGRVRLRLGDQDLTLTRVQAAEYDTRIPHAASAAGNRPAQVISIFNDGGARMHVRLSAHPDDDEGDHLDIAGTTDQLARNGS